MKPENVDQLPDHPGVYLMRDVGGKVIYVGKANSLRKRVRSYFGRTHESPRLRALVTRIESVETFLVDSEREALILELNLIKEHRPRYNVQLKDDKRYPFIRVTVNEPYPRVFGTRETPEDGSLTFGPYTNAQAMRRVLGLIQQIFPLRTCASPLPSKTVRLCLDYQIKKCLGPCEEKISQEEYRRMVDKVILLLKGKNRSLVEELRAEMEEASAAELYEKAAILRDQIAAVQSVIERQRVSSSDPVDRDVFAFSGGGEEIVAVLLRVREGKMTGKETFFVRPGAEEEPLGPLLKRLYATAPSIPSEILADREPADRAAIEEWLSASAGVRVRILVPQRGDKKRLVELAEANARHEEEAALVRKLARKDRSFQALRQLQRELELPVLPRRIECFDISNLGDRDLVGSSVCFLDGLPEKSRYRRYRIRTVKGVDDFASIGETVRRRFRRLIAEGDELPDLVLIDGGKGQLAAAVVALQEAGAGDVPAASLAKREEEVFRPALRDPIRFADGPALRLLQRIRDEAHRFAITYQRRRRGKGATRSVLDEVPGLGDERKRRLIERFGSVTRIRAASEKEIALLPGLGPVLARRVLDRLRGARP